MLVQIIPFLCTYLTHPPPPPLPAITYLNRIIKTRRGGSKTAPIFVLAYLGYLRCCWRKSLLSVLDFVRRLIREVYVYSQFTLPHPPPSSHPPSETHSAQGESGPSAEWRIEACHIPPAPVSLHCLGSAVSSPVTLPYNNLGRRQAEE